MSNQLTLMIQRHEGLSLAPYTDTTGHLTIGWGHNISASPLDPGLLLSDGSISLDTAELLLETDISAAEDDLTLALSWFPGLDVIRQAALTDMCFNMGIETLLTFQTFLGMVSAGNYVAAADDVLKTLWSTQVGARSLEVAAMIRTGRWQ